MIQMPRRSVTRFFIPLIDVLILMFCIFLLMPIVEGRAGPSVGDLQALKNELERLRRERDTPRVRELEAELERLHRQARRTLGERLFVRTFELLDTEKTTLVYNEGGEIVRLEGENAALKLRDRDREWAAEHNRELYYVILTPRGKLRPRIAEQREIEQVWFPGVPIKWDISPRPGGGTNP